MPRGIPQYNTDFARSADGHASLNLRRVVMNVPSCWSGFVALGIVRKTKMMGTFHRLQLLIQVKLRLCGTGRTKGALRYLTKLQCSHRRSPDPIVCLREWMIRELPRGDPLLSKPYAGGNGIDCPQTRDIPSRPTSFSQGNATSDPWTYHNAFRLLIYLSSLNTPLRIKPWVRQRSTL